MHWSLSWHSNSMFALPLNPLFRCSIDALLTVVALWPSKHMTTLPIIPSFHWCINRFYAIQPQHSHYYIIHCSIVLLMHYSLFWPFDPVNTNLKHITTLPILPLFHWCIDHLHDIQTPCSYYHIIHGSIIPLMHYSLLWPFDPVNTWPRHPLFHHSIAALLVRLTTRDLFNPLFHYWIDALITFVAI